MNFILQQALAPSTQATYSAGARAFLNFTIGYDRLNPGGNPLPASEETLMLFASFLSLNLKPASIKTYLFAVRNLHVEQGLPNPLEGCLQLQRLLRGIKRVYGASQDNRMPITPILLRSFKTHLNTTYKDHKMIWAAMLLAFFGFLRSSELVALNTADISRESVGYRLHIKASKTDPFRKGTSLIVASSGDPILCAVRAMDLYLEGSQPRGTLFRFATSGALSQRHFNHLIKDLAQRVGIPVSRYSTHSFRIGAATTAAAAGIPDWKIKMLGRWLSDSYQTYVRTPEHEVIGVSAAMAATRA